MPSLADLFAKPAPRSEEMTLESSWRNAHDPCHLSNLQPLNMAKPPHSTVDLRQGMQGPFYNLKLLLARVVFFWVGPRIREVSS